MNAAPTTERLTHPRECSCRECADWDADEELGFVDLEDRLDAALERATSEG